MKSAKRVIASKVAVYKKGWYSEKPISMNELAELLENATNVVGGGSIDSARKNYSNAYVVSDAQKDNVGIYFFTDPTTEFGDARPIDDIKDQAFGLLNPLESAIEYQDDSTLMKDDVSIEGINLFLLLRIPYDDSKQLIDFYGLSDSVTEENQVGNIGDLDQSYAVYDVMGSKKRVTAKDIASKVAEIKQGLTKSAEFEDFDTPGQFPIYTDDEGADLFDLRDMLQQYHSGQWDPIYAIQSRDMVDPSRDELIAITELLEDISRGEYDDVINEYESQVEDPENREDKDDWMVASSWLSIVQRMLSTEPEFMEEYNLSDEISGTTASTGKSAGFETDDSVVMELYLYTVNSSELYGKRQSIEKNLINKMSQGIYDSERAVQAFMYLVDAAAASYAQEFGGSSEGWHEMFPKNIRQEVARDMVEYFETEAGLGNYDSMLHKKYQTAPEIEEEIL